MYVHNYVCVCGQICIHVFMLRMSAGTRIKQVHRRILRHKPPSVYRFYTGIWMYMKSAQRWGWGWEKGRAGGGGREREREREREIWRQGKRQGERKMEREKTEKNFSPPIPATQSHRSTCSGWWRGRHRPWRWWRCQRAQTSEPALRPRTLGADGRWTGCSPRGLDVTHKPHVTLGHTLHLLHTLLT